MRRQNGPKPAFPGVASLGGLSPITAPVVLTGGDRRSAARSSVVLSDGQASRQAGVLTSSRRALVFVGSTRMPGPMVDERVTDFRYRPFDAAGFTRMSSSIPAW